MNRAVSRLLLLAVAAIAVGAAVVVWRVGDFLAHPVAISSTSGVRVFNAGQTLVAYPDFAPGVGPIILVAGFTLLALAVFVAAITWTGRRAAHPPRR